MMPSPCAQNFPFFVPSSGPPFLSLVLVAPLCAVLICPFGRTTSGIYKLQLLPCLLFLFIDMLVMQVLSRPTWTVLTQPCLSSICCVFALPILYSHPVDSLAFFFSFLVFSFLRLTRCVWKQLIRFTLI